MPADLFGLEQQTARKGDRPEAAALVEVLTVVRTHSSVAFVARDLPDVLRELDKAKELQP